MSSQDGPPRKIQKLDEVVVNRIAAGEVIQRPCNAIKEMIENCLDAKAKSIQVTVKSGGLKLIQILDDGCGIRKEDMGIVCERFTTSKLQSFDDLKSISTYGFRGEALASISHVAHLTITTRTPDCPCAYRARYEDGKMVPLTAGAKAETKACAGNKGTQINVEDLFYNVPVRQKALKNPTEEYARIADVVSKYSIHNPSVSFTLKKHGENMAGVRTQMNSSVQDNIKTIFGASVARELLEVSMENKGCGFEMTGWISNANYSMKKCTFLLFINHRLVESSNLKRALESVYVNYLPKDKHPFMYMSLQINPLNIDVNVHPTKHEVKFLHEDTLVEEVQKCVETRLLGANESRHYYTQSLIPKLVNAGLELPVSEVLPPSTSEVQKKLYDHQMTRTDNRERKLQAFFTPTDGKENNNSKVETSSNNVKASGATTEGGSVSSITVEILNPRKSVDENVTSPKNVLKEQNHTSAKKGPTTPSNVSTSTKQTPTSGKTKRAEAQCELTSVKNLRKAIDANEHLGLKNILEDHKFVGCVDGDLSLVQHLTRLYLVNTKRLSEELFYQILIFRFGRFGMLELSSPAPIHELVMLALESPQSGWSEADGEKPDLAQFIVDLLQSKADMLLDYLSIEINARGELLTLPILLDNYTPCWTRLPMFLLRLATEVNWEDEQECFETFCRECSRLYTFSEDHVAYADDQDDQKWKLTVEHTLFPAFRTSLLPTRKFAEDGTFLEVANLPDLYKVFERC